MDQHHEGPYCVQDSQLIYISEDHSKFIDGPSVLIDKETLTIHKIGSREFVLMRYTKMYDALSQSSIYGASDMLGDLLMITFDLNVFSVDELATMFNAMYQCTGTRIIELLVENNLPDIKSEIERLALAGY